MAIITAAKKDVLQKGVSPVSRVAIPGLVGLTLLLLSLTQIRSEMTLVDANDVLWRVGKGEAVSGAELTQASLEFVGAAQAVPHNAQYWENAALLAMLATLSSGQANDMESIQSNIHQAAQLAPSQSSIWANLAHADFLAGRISDNTLKALRLSFLTGRLELMELSVRLRLCLTIWNDLPTDLRDQVATDLNHLWRGNQKQLAEIYVTLPTAAKLRMADLLPTGEAAIIQIMRRKEQMDKARAR
jgi:hypothetical protein